MTVTCRLIDHIVGHVETAGQGPRARRARRAVQRWQQGHPVFARFDSPAEIARFGRQAAPADKDRILTALVCEAPGDEWAQLTALAVLAPRLAWIVSCWARHPGARAVVADLEAELVAECWAAITTPVDGPPPARPGLVLADRAWARVRDRRVKDRRRSEREENLPERMPIAAGDDTSGEVLLAGRLNDAVAAGEIALSSARSVYLTRVAGLSTAETAQALGTSPAHVRVLRWRAARQLADGEQANDRMAA